MSATLIGDPPKSRRRRLPTRCVVCGIKLYWYRWNDPLHRQNGKLDRMLRTPYPHNATENPTGRDERGMLIFDVMEPAAP